MTLPLKHLTRALTHALILLVILFALGPVVLLLFNALRSNDAILTRPIGVPTAPIWTNFPAAWQAARFDVALRNSSVVAVATVLGVAALAFPCGYALARRRPRGAGTISAYLLLAITVPAQLYMVPLFFMWARLNLVDNLYALIPIYCAVYLPFSIFLLRSYFLSLPAELEDAARIDGCSEAGVLWHIVLPLAMPVVTTLAVIVAVWSWNEFLFAAMMLRSAELRTVTIAFLSFSSSFETDYAQQSAGALILMAPVILVYALLQRQFVRGVVQGGLKV